jgi:pilus assembly protein CpaC
MKRLIPILAWGAVAILSELAFPRASHAQEEVESSSCRGASPHQISLRKGQSKVCDLPQDAAEIFVADPKIANALVRAPHQLYLIGVDAGQTTVIALDHTGRKIADYDLSINTPPLLLIDIDGLQKMLRAAMPGAAIKARLANQTIVLTGTVDSPEEAQQAFDIAKAFRSPIAAAQGPSNGNGPQSQNVNVSTGPQQYVPPNQSQAQDANGIINLITIRGRAQVMLKVTVAEVSREVAKQLGITTSSLTASWGTFTQFNPFPINGVIAPALAASQLVPGYGNPSTAITAHNPDNTLSATLQAFERYGVTRVLAEPTVSAVSGESAVLTVGGEIPIPGPSTCQGGGCTGGGAIFQPYGVLLKFTPTVLAEGRIELHVATEVTELDTQTGQTVFGTFVPGLLTRKNQTVVEIPSGGSIASAGLLQTLSHQAINGLPGLLDLPILGALFRSRDYQKQETELMIIVTPYIVKPVQANQIAKPTDGFSDASDPQAWLLGRINRLYASPGNQEAIQDYKGPVGFIQD